MKKSVSSLVFALSISTLAACSGSNDNKNSVPVDVNGTYHMPVGDEEQANFRQKAS